MNSFIDVSIEMNEGSGTSKREKMFDAQHLQI